MEASDTSANAAESIAPRLVAGLQQFGFQRVAIPVGREHEFADTRLIMKRQTWNTNRAVVLTSLQSIPADFKEYLIVLRNRTAVLCKYIPVLWEIGIQVVVVAPGLADPAKYVALVDNQWAIIQSVFLIDPLKAEYRWARTWGQVITGKFQDAIDRVLAEDFRKGS
ncbi:MAG TPA: hypothetical protein VII75_03180 [Thermoanaerobaculia bacterium]